MGKDQRIGYHSTTTRGSVLHIITLLVFGMIGVFWPAGYCTAQQANRVTLDSDIAPLFSGFKEWMITPPGTSTKVPAVDQKVPEGAAVFKIVKVTNISGNNPFHPTQPVLNFGGVVVANVDDLVQCVRGGICKTKTASGTACSPQRAQSSSWMSIVLGIVTSTSQCGVVHAPVPAPFNEEAFYTYYDSGRGIIVGPGSPNFAIVTPPAPSAKSGSEYIVNPGSYTMIIRYPLTGQKWFVNFSVFSDGISTVTLTVTSIKAM